MLLRVGENYDDRARRAEGLGTFRHTRILLIGVILPLFCLLDLTVDRAQHVRMERFLQTASDAAVIEGARTLARGGSRRDAEADLRQAFQAMTALEARATQCGVASIRVFEADRSVSIETACVRPPRIGAIVLGGTPRRATVFAQAVFANPHNATAGANSAPVIWLIN